MAEDRCTVCGQTQDLLYCSKCEDMPYCCRDHQVSHWKVHKKYCKYIPGTTIKRDTPEGPNPMAESTVHDRRWGSGQSLRDPIAQFIHFKYNKDGSNRALFVYPGRLTPYIMDATPAQQRARDFKRADHISTPYQEEGDKKVRLPSGKYRHIADFSVKELRKMGWDGAMAVSMETCRGEYVPFVCGYDSDKEDEYEPVDLEKARESGLLGLPPGSGTYCELALQGSIQQINRDRVRRR
jgi:hypothetical protein